MTDPFDLQRFIAAQDENYDQALAELKAGRKRTHWVWYVFPQILGLGHSDTARYYSIRSADEARAYLQHPLLGKRLLECTEAVLGHTGVPPGELMGSPDDMKLRSSMTLFDAVSTSADDPFAAVLQAFYAGERDPATLQRLE